MAALLSAVAAIYFLFRTRTFYWDGVLFALTIESVARGEAPFGTLFHPNHLLYNVLGYGAYSVGLLFGLPLRAIYWLQYLNLLCSILCSYFVFRVAELSYARRDVAYFCCLLFSSGALWWHFSTDADAYILATLLITASFGLLLRSKPLLCAMAGVFQVLAMCVHELSVFFYVPAIVALISEERLSVRHRLLRSAVYVTATAATTAAIYYFCYLHVPITPGSTFLGWVSSRAEDAHFRWSWATVIISNLNSYTKLFLGGKLSFLSEFASFASVTALVLMTSTLAFALYQFLRRQTFKALPALETSLQKHTRTVRLLAAWLVPYALFLSIWLPWNGFYKLFLWPPIVLLLGCLVTKHGKFIRFPGAYIGLTVAIAAWNFAGYILPHSHAAADPVLALSEKIERELPGNAVIYYQQFVTDDWYLRYFAPGRAWRPLPHLESARELSLLANSSSPVCFETSALAVLGSEGFVPQWNSSYQWSLVSSKYNFQLRCIALHQTDRTY